MAKNPIRPPIMAPVRCPLLSSCVGVLIPVPAVKIPDDSVKSVRVLEIFGSRKVTKDVIGEEDEKLLVVVVVGGADEPEVMISAFAVVGSGDGVAVDPSFSNTLSNL